MKKSRPTTGPTLEPGVRDTRCFYRFGSTYCEPGATAPVIKQRCTKDDSKEIIVNTAECVKEGNEEKSK